MNYYRACGVICILLGTLMITCQFVSNKVLKIIRTSLPLVDGSEIYKAWSSPLDIMLGCYLFNVTNPDEVMRGENPNLVEYGPFIYNEIFEKQILDTNDETDEITYTTKTIYKFNRYLSVNASRSEKITILNPAYIGTISMLSALPPDYLNKYGDNIPKLFPNRSSIFLKARPTDILFDGVKVSCNTRKFPELNLICKTLKGSRPLVLRETEKEDVYLFSIFQRMNDTFLGPYTVNRGLKNITKLGDISSYKGKHYQTIWSSDSCNAVRGTDTITWAPLIEPLPYVSTFIPDLCRTMEADYDDEVSIHGLTGSRFIMGERIWYLNETRCYCLLVKKKAECLPQGLIDVSECQKVPVILSEPHFLHADPQLLTYAHGLNPDERTHGTYIIIEPLTGTPLSGRKKVQVNVKLSRQPVELLQNVSEGYFPILWCEEGNTPTLSVIAFTYQTLRLMRAIAFIEKVPLITGIYMVVMSMLYLKFEKRKVKPATLFTESILISSNSQNHIARGSPPQVT